MLISYSNLLDTYDYSMERYNAYYLLNSFGSVHDQICLPAN